VPVRIDLRAVGGQQHEGTVRRLHAQGRIQAFLQRYGAAQARIEPFGSGGQIAQVIQLASQLLKQLARIGSLRLQPHFAAERLFSQCVDLFRGLLVIDRHASPRIFVQVIIH